MLNKLLFGLLLPLASYSQDSDSQLSSDTNLKGNVKSFSIRSEWLQDDYKDLKLGVLNEHDRLYGNYYMEFDQNGNWSKFEHLHRNGDLNWGENTIYTPDGRLIQEINYDSSGTTTFFWKNIWENETKMEKSIFGNADTNVYFSTLYFFDDNDSLLRTEDYDSANLLIRYMAIAYENEYKTKITGQFDAQGNLNFLIKEIRNKQGAITNSFMDSRVDFLSSFPGFEFLEKLELPEQWSSQDLYVYKKKGRVKEKWLVSDENKRIEEKWIFDKNGRKIEYYYFAPPDYSCGVIHDEIETYKYDLAGNMVERTIQGHSFDKYVYEFNEAGYCTSSKRLNEKEKVVYEQTWKFNELGHICEYKRYSDGIQDSLFSFTVTFEYDIFNNWTSRKEYRKGQLYYISNCIYEYH